MSMQKEYGARIMEQGEEARRGITNGVSSDDGWRVIIIRYHELNNYRTQGNK